MQHFEPFVLAVIFQLGGVVAVVWLLVGVGVAPELPAKAEPRANGARDQGEGLVVADDLRACRERLAVDVPGQLFEAESIRAAVLIQRSTGDTEG